jgi:hypothetical protein
VSEQPLAEPSLLLRAGGAIALLILMFATSWFGLSTAAHGSFGASGSTAAGVWKMLTVVRWLLLVAAGGALLSIAVRHPHLADAALLLGVIATATLFYRLLINLPDPHAVLDVKVGGYLALVACGALTLGAYEAPEGPGGAPESSGTPPPAIE